MHVLFCGPISLITIAADDADACQFEAVNPMNGLQKKHQFVKCLTQCCELETIKIALERGKSAP